LIGTDRVADYLLSSAPIGYPEYRSEKIEAARTISSAPDRFQMPL
jgi:hypothetical protein